MTKHEQIQLNVQLSEDLANYLVANPKERLSFPGGTSYVVFSADNDELNTLNEALIEPLKSEGKTIVRATESREAKPWMFSVVPA